MTTGSHGSSSSVPAECALEASKEHLRNDDSLLKEELIEEAGICCPLDRNEVAMTCLLSISYHCGFYKHSLSEAVYYY